MNKFSLLLLAVSCYALSSYADNGMVDSFILGTIQNDSDSAIKIFTNNARRVSEFPFLILETPITIGAGSKMFVNRPIYLSQNIGRAFKRAQTISIRKEDKTHQEVSFVCDYNLKDNLFVCGLYERDLRGRTNIISKDSVNTKDESGRLSPGEKMSYMVNITIKGNVLGQSEIEIFPTVRPA